MKNSMLTLTASEIVQVDGGFVGENFAAGTMGLFAGIGYYPKIAASTIYSADVFEKAIGLLKDASFFIMLIVGGIRSWNYMTSR